MKITINHEESDFYDTKTLATLLDVTPDWLNHNRSSKNPIPYIKISYRLILYNKSKILAWIGRKDLSLNFFSTKTLAKKLNISVAWLQKNRTSNNPIPFRKFGYLVRYQREEVLNWLRKNNKNT